MRTLAASLTVILLGAFLSGCTSDGNLGAPLDGPPVSPTIDLEGAAPAHPGDLRVSATRWELDGGLAPIEVPTIALVPEQLPVAPRGEMGLVLATDVGPTHFALSGARVDGALGWLVFNATGAPTLTGEGAGIRLLDFGIRANGTDLSARIVGSTLVRTRSPSDPAQDLPPGFDDAPVGHLEDAILLPDRVSVHAQEIAFYAAGSASARALGASAVIDASDAILVAFLSGDPFDPMNGVVLEIPIAPAPTNLAWSGNLTLTATAPSGTVKLATREIMLGAHNDAFLRMRGAASATLTRGEHEWTLAQENVDLLDVRTGGTPHLAATLRLAPDTLNATGPAGNTTRVKLILAETSLGADAHVLGYRIDPSVDARYVGWEPFAITNELLDLLNETEGPITPFLLIPIGIALPYIAIAEAFANMFTFLFPPTLEGVVEAGQGKVLTFELEMPETARDVVLVIEAKNADPVEATIRMEPLT